LYIAGGWLLPGRKRVVPYSIQTLKRLKPAQFRQDLMELLDLLRQHKIKPLIAQRLPLGEARQAHELLAKGGVTGKIVLVCNQSSLESGGVQKSTEVTKGIEPRMDTNRRERIWSAGSHDIGKTKSQRGKLRLKVPCPKRK
jgi:hypothetical protein